jgi:hypothetical protein
LESRRSSDIDTQRATVPPSQVGVIETLARGFHCSLLISIGIGIQDDLDIAQSLRLVVV